MSWEVVTVDDGQRMRRFPVPGGWIYNVSYGMAGGCAVFVPAPMEQVKPIESDVRTAYNRGFSDGFNAAALKAKTEGEKVKPVAQELAEGWNAAHPESPVTWSQGEKVKPADYQRGYADATEHAKADGWLERATDLLSESLSKWEDEEDSVKEEKADHIADLNKFFNDYAAAGMLAKSEKVKPSELASTLAEERAVTARMCAELFNRAADALLDAGHVTWGGIVAELREAARRVVG